MITSSPSAMVGSIVGMKPTRGGMMVDIEKMFVIGDPMPKELAWPSLNK